MRETKVIISVDDEHLSKFSEVVKKVRKAGLKVESQLDSIGLIGGSIEESKFDSLSNVEGVSRVKRDEQDFQLPPPDSELQ